jgi:hypothetical protein
VAVGIGSEAGIGLSLTNRLVVRTPPSDLISLGCWNISVPGVAEGVTGISTSSSGWQLARIGRDRAPVVARPIFKKSRRVRVFPTNSLVEYVVLFLKLAS